jgi:hypothetical protein
MPNSVVVDRGSVPPAAGGVGEGFDEILDLAPSDFSA